MQHESVEYDTIMMDVARGVGVAVGGRQRRRELSLLSHT